MNPILRSKRNFDLDLPGYIVLEQLDMDPDPCVQTQGPISQKVIFTC